MAHPSEHFIKYTLAQAWNDEDPAQTSVEAISRSLKLFGLPFLSDREYERIKLSFNPPDSFRFHNMSHRETEEFMKAEKIFTLWKPEDDDRRVITEIVAGQALVKHDLHILLMGRLPREVIAQKLNTKYKIYPALTPRMIDTYHHYFWYVHNTTHDEWADLLTGRIDMDALMAALYCGEQQALYRAGFSPSVDPTRALKESFRQAYFRLEYLRHQPDSKGVYMAFTSLTARITSLHEILHAQGGGLHEQLKAFRQIMMKHNDPDIKAIDTIIDKVAGGSYSGDGEENSQGDHSPKGDQQDE